MKLINDNLKKAGYFNAALIVIAIAFQVKALFNANALLTDKIFYILYIVGLVSGLIYSLSGYKKDSAKYYKSFMIIYALLSTYSIVSKIVNNIAIGMELFHIATTILSVIADICIIVLAFTKDLGKSKSYSLIITNLVIILGSTVLGFIVSEGFINLVEIWLPLVMLSIIAYIFVCAKFADKEARGAK